MNIILVGPPGAGKGTQARMLHERRGLVQISPGEMLRAHAAAGTEIGKIAGPLIDKGCLVPTELILDMIIGRIIQPDCARGFIFDGFPRTLPQARELETELAKLNIHIDVLVELLVDDNLLTERIIGRYMCARCGAGYHDKFYRSRVEGVCDICGNTTFTRRADDTEETVQRRLATYHAETRLILPYYAEKGLVRQVNGMAAIPEVYRQLEAILYPLPLSGGKA